MPLLNNHNVGLRYLIKPGDDLSATKLRKNILRIRDAANNMVDASIEPGAINTRHLSDRTTPSKGSFTDGYWKDLYTDETDTDVSLSSLTTSYAEIWFSIFGGASVATVPNVPLFIEIHLEVRDRNQLSGTTNIDARYWFQMQVAVPNVATLEVPRVLGQGVSNFKSPERSVTLAAVDGVVTDNAYERQQVVLAAPFIPTGAPSPDLTSLKVALFAKATDYAGTGAPAAKTATITRSKLVVKAVRR